MLPQLGTLSRNIDINIINITINFTKKRGSGNMSYLYINENGANISVEESYVKVSYKDGLIKKIPIETLDSIQIFSKANMTTPCTIECIKRGNSSCLLFEKWFLFWQTRINRTYKCRTSTSTMSFI